MSNYPVIPTIKDFNDAKKALDSLRTYFNGKIKEESAAAQAAAPKGAAAVVRTISGSTDSTDSNIAEYDGTTGKLIKDGGLSHVDVADAILKKDTAVGVVTVTQPATGSTLTIADGKTLTATDTWNLQALATGETGNTMDDTKHVNVTIGGTPVKLAVIS